MGDENNVEVLVHPVNDDLHGRNFSMSTSDPEKCNRKNIWFIISQVNGVTSLLRVVTQYHEDKVIGSLEPSKYQYSVGRLTVANPVSGRLGAVEVSTMLEQQTTDVSFRKRFALSIANGGRSGYCFQKLADSVEQKTE